VRAAGQGVPHFPQFWLNGQLALDLYRASHDEEELRQLERIEPVAR
jgi:plasmid maintenance system antidote protein VapI